MEQGSKHREDPPDPVLHTTQTNASSKDGFGMTWAVNVLAPFVLTANLLDHVQHRIVNVASLSAAHSINVADDLHRLSGHPAYSCR